MRGDGHRYFAPNNRQLMAVLRRCTPTWTRDSSRLAALHGLEESGVGLGLLHAVDQQLHRGDIVHAVE